jgi:hypothetical protein
LARRKVFGSSCHRCRAEYSLIRLRTCYQIKPDLRGCLFENENGLTSVMSGTRRLFSAGSYGRFIRTSSATATATCTSSVRGSDNRGARGRLAHCRSAGRTTERTVACPRYCAIERGHIPAFDVLGFSLAEQLTFDPLGAARFRSTNRRRKGLHRVASAALEDAVLESSHAGVYTLQIHIFPTRRAARAFCWQQLR